MSSLGLSVQTLAGVPDLATIQSTLEQLLAPVRHLKLRVDEGPIIDAHGDLNPLAAFVDQRPLGSFTSRGPKGLEVAMSWHNVAGVAEIAPTGRLGLHVKASAVDEQAMVDAMIALVRSHAAPLATLEESSGPLNQRANAHRNHYQTDKVGTDRVFGLERGLSGLAWRTVFGPCLVEFLGPKRLASLPSEHAEKLDDDMWLVSLGGTASAPEGADELVAALGSEFFFDPIAFAEPSVRPTIPQVTHLPHRVRRRSADGELEWQTANGYGTDASMVDDSPKGGTDPVAMWNAMRSAYSEARTSQLRNGYIPEVIVIAGPAGNDLTAFVASPDVDYVVPDVDVILAGAKNKQRWIERSDLEPALEQFDHISADYRFSHDDVHHVVGIGHRTDDTNQHSADLRAALATMGTPVDPSGIQRRR